MKLSDIDLTPTQAAAFVRWLNEEMEAQRRTDDAAAEREERNALADERYEGVVSLARQTAERHGPLIGVRAEDQARAAWAAFIDNEGCFSTFDVDERFDPTGSSIYEEGWMLSYASVIDEMRRVRR